MKQEQRASVGSLVPHVQGASGPGLRLMRRTPKRQQWRRAERPHPGNNWPPVGDTYQ